jgi:hypothetical protein
LTSPRSFGLSRTTLLKHAAAVLLGVTVSSHQLQAQDYFGFPEFEFAESLPAPPKFGWRPKHLFWKHDYFGVQRYGSGCKHLTRSHEWRLSVCPPLFPPEFGYTQPCWRQIAVERRCQYCPPAWNPGPLPVIPDLSGHSPLNAPTTPAPQQDYEPLPVPPAPASPPELIPEPPDPEPPKTQPKPELRQESGKKSSNPPAPKASTKQPARPQVLPATYLDMHTSGLEHGPGHCS